jgi:hypothetical protein
MFKQPPIQVIGGCLILTVEDQADYDYTLRDV